MYLRREEAQYENQTNEQLLKTSPSIHPMLHPSDHQATIHPIPSPSHVLTSHPSPPTAFR
jgi:hypothetical protein